STPPPPAAIYPLSLHDALPIFSMREVDLDRVQFVTAPNGQHPDDENRITLKEPDASELFEEINSGTDLTGAGDKDDPSGDSDARSEEHTSELQSRFDLVCRLLL